MPQRNQPSTASTSRAQSRRWPAILSIAALAAVSLASAATAQLDAGGMTGADTRYTPVPHETTAWIQVAGAAHGEDRAPATSATPVHVDFYDVAFESDLHGFAVGARCEQAPPDDLTGDTLTDHLASCPRIPVIYEYLETDTGASWRPVYEGTAGSERGFAGSVAFMRDGTALAVGGDGIYPRREIEDAGDARAWIYNGTFWSKLDEPKMQPGMRGMTAVAMSARAGDCGDRVQCGFAGGLRQLWTWRDGRFVQGYFPDAADNPEGAEEGPMEEARRAEFRFRVRDIEFTPGPEAEAVKAVAVTSGCCDDADQLNNTPRVLLVANDAAGVTTVHPRALTVFNVGDSRRDAPDSFYALGLRNNGANYGLSIVAAPGRRSNAPVGELASRVLGNLQVSPGARAVSGIDDTNFLLPDVGNARLVDGDGARLTGNTGSHWLDWSVGSLPGEREGDDQGVAFFSWPHEEEVLGTAPIPIIQVLECQGRGFPWAMAGGSAGIGAPPDTQCKPYEPDAFVEQTKSRHLFRLPSYALNAFSFSDRATEAVGWAVGDRGAIVRLGGIGTTLTAGVEPSPAKVGPATTARFAGSDVYDAFRPLPSDGGTEPVPSLAANGVEQLDRPRFVPGGAPAPTLATTEPAEDVKSMVMSRDGSEGWAVGAGHGAELTNDNLPGMPAAPTLYHYDGSRWSRCDIRGVPALLPADPACAELAGLFTSGPNGSEVQLTYVARIPLENDDDPSNDDEFEAIAAGTLHDGPGTGPTVPVLVRYQRGRWFVDEESSRQLSTNSGSSPEAIHAIAFTAPDDGWMLDSRLGGGPTIRHWDGQKWWLCNSGGGDSVSVARNQCGDPDDLLPIGSAALRPAGLTVAGSRIYMTANRDAGGGGDIGSTAGRYPLILYKDRGGHWSSDGGGYDPGCAERTQEATPTSRASCGADPDAGTDGQGSVVSLEVVEGPDGYTGWALGEFGDQLAQTAGGNSQSIADQSPPSLDSHFLMRLEGGSWRPFLEDDAAADYLPSTVFGSSDRPPRVTVVDPDRGTAILWQQMAPGASNGLALAFDPDRGKSGRWRILQLPFKARPNGAPSLGALLRSVVSDGQGGAWLGARARINRSGSGSAASRPAVHFWHYKTEAPKEVFDEAPHPIREVITGGAAGADGSFWVTTNSGFVYRYDRLTGWDKLRIPGWDPGSVVTRNSEANAVTVGPDGEGLVVGKNGRIAGISPLGVRLDEATGKACGEPPCATGRDLRAVAVAADKSALAGGEGGVLLYRPPGGQFGRIALPGISDAAVVTAISMPSPDRAWVATSIGQVFAGTRSGDTWAFTVENRATGGKLLSLDRRGQALPVRGVQVDAQGEGYAVGDRGLILERRGDAGWQRIKTGFLDGFRSVALPPQGRDGGALIGGEMGLILTLVDGDFRVAREADLWHPLNFGDSNTGAAAVVGVALLTGVKEGQMEAWAVQRSPQGVSRGGPASVLHYTNAPDETLMRPGSRVEPIRDTPEPRPGEISFAAFGRSECHFSGATCPEGQSEGLFHEVIARRVAKEVIERSGRPGGPAFAVFTGDVGRGAGREGDDAGRSNLPVHRSWVHRRWVEQIADRFADAEVPLFGAVGLNDLDRTGSCFAGACADAKQLADGTGLTLGWRRAMADMPAPWGTGPRQSREGLDFRPVGDSGTEEPVLSTLEEPQARTHYAVDMRRDDGRVARLIVLDNSMRTLASSDPNQNPLEPDGGQTAWLERVLSDMPENQQAIVVMNTPTYSYATGDPTTWAGDATALEATMMQHDVKVVVSGRLGWNGRYWARAPGLHSPCFEGDYIHDDDAPAAGDPPCEDQTAAATDPADRVGDALADALSGLGAPAPPGEGEDPAPSVQGQGLLPFVVAASAGGRFGPRGTDDGAASDGWWHGYSIVRLDKSGDPRKTIVEQRPVFDWISITASTHALKPRQRVTLRGEGREPVGMDAPARYDAINSHAITHRYDLVLADEQNPALPRKGSDGKYIEVPKSVGTVNRETGVVSADAGRQERTYAVAILSVGDKAASWPLVFEPAKSFQPRPVPAPSVIRTPPATPPVTRVPPPPVVINQPPAPTPPGTPPPTIPSVTLPTLQLPPPPAFPPLPPTPTGTPTPTPPPPPAPPAPPGSQGALPLSLQAPLSPISIVTTVIPPSPPPVNPAPPGGSAARKEARQRQAATAKSEEGGGDQAGTQESQSGGESGAATTRRDRTRPAPSFTPNDRRDDRRYSFTAVSHHEQASAWSRGALYGGMTVVTALVLALGWSIAGPTPKRRHPPRPAPGTVRTLIGRRDGGWR